MYNEVDSSVKENTRLKNTWCKHLNLLNYFTKCFSGGAYFAAWGLFSQ